MDSAITKRIVEILTVALADEKAAKELASLLTQLEKEVIIMPIQENIVVGGRTIVIDDKTVMLQSELTDIGQVPDSGRCSTLHKNSVAYQVPANKKLVIKAVYNMFSGGSQIVLGYADSPFADNADGADLAAANPVFLGGGSGPTGNVGEIDPETARFEISGVGTASGISIPNFEVPAGKYPFVQCPNNGANSVLVFICELK